MSYESQAELARDDGFRARVVTCSKEQALIFKDDGRADIAALADAIILSAANALPLVELAAVAPNFRDVDNPDDITDDDVLAVVQNIWPTYAAVRFPPPEEPAP